MRSITDLVTALSAANAPAAFGECAAYLNLVGLGGWRLNEPSEASRVYMPASHFYRIYAIRQTGVRRRGVDISGIDHLVESLAELRPETPIDAFYASATGGRDWVYCFGAPSSMRLHGVVLPGSQNRARRPTGAAPT